MRVRVRACEGGGGGGDNILDISELKRRCSSDIQCFLSDLTCSPPGLHESPFDLKILPSHQTSTAPNRTSNASYIYIYEIAVVVNC